MKHKLNFDIFIDQAISDAFHRYTLSGYNFDHVARCAAADLIKNWGPELAIVFSKAIKAEMEEQWSNLAAGRSSTATSD